MYHHFGIRVVNVYHSLAPPTADAPAVSQVDRLPSPEVAGRVAHPALGRKAYVKLHVGSQSAKCRVLGISQAGSSAFFCLSYAETMLFDYRALDEEMKADPTIKLTVALRFKKSSRFQRAKGRTLCHNETLLANIVESSNVYLPMITSKGDRIGIAHLQFMPLYADDAWKLDMPPVQYMPATASVCLLRADKKVAIDPSELGMCLFRSALAGDDADSEASRDAAAAAAAGGDRRSSGARRPAPLLKESSSKLSDSARSLLDGMADEPEVSLVADLGAAMRSLRSAETAEQAGEALDQIAVLRRATSDVVALSKADLVTLGRIVRERAPHVWTKEVGSRFLLLLMAMSEEAGGAESS